MDKKIKKNIADGRTIHIGVEGANFMHLLIRKISDDPNFNKICVWDFDEESINRKDWLSVVKAQIDRGIQGVGLICDIDSTDGNGRADRVVSVSQLFENIFNIKLKENEVLKNESDIFCGFNVVPSSGDQGCLETALLENYKSPYSECAVEFVECLNKAGAINNSNKKDKAMVRSLSLAADPDMPLSATAKRNLWDWDQGSLLDMLTFIKSMNDSI